MHNLPTIELIPQIPKTSISIQSLILLFIVYITYFQLRDDVHVWKMLCLFYTRL